MTSKPKLGEKIDYNIVLRSPKDSNPTIGNSVYHD